MTSLEIVHAYYAAFNRKDWDGMLALLDPAIRHEPNQGDPRTGLDKYAEFLGQMDKAYDETLADLVLMRNDAGDRIAAEFTVHGVYKQGEEGLPPARGQSYQLPAGAFLEVRDGRIKRVTTYYNLPLWIKLVSA